MLLGFKNPDVRTFGFPNLPGVRVGPNGELRSPTLSGDQFAGVSVIGIAGTTAIEMRIVKTFTPDTLDPRWRYELEQRDPSTGDWSAACDNPALLVPTIDPPVARPLAIATTGHWQDDGVYSVTGNRITFACKTGVTAKCVGWGYGETEHWPDHTEHGLPVTVTGADMLQACTRMARADYCAGGMPNTLDGTPINISTVFKSLPPEPGFRFEGAWPGVAVNDRLIQRLPVVCLTKLRWSTLPLGGNCPNALPDPRTDVKGQFCEDLKSGELEEKGARLYSSSSFLDAGLYTYTDPAGDLRFTTASLLPGAVGKVPEWTIPPPAGVSFPVAGEDVQLEATIFPPSLPVQLGNLQLVKLSSYRCEDDLVTSTESPAVASCAHITTEGQIYPPNTPGRAPLRHWYNPNIKHSYTTVKSPTTMIAAGWNLIEVVGAVIRPSLPVNVRWSSLSGFSYTLAIQTRAGEWIPSCVDSAHIGSSPGFVYQGVCVGAVNRAVKHDDIATFRVNYKSATQTYEAIQAYDGYSSDVYVALPAGTTTALAVAWPDLGAGVAYAFDVRPNDEDWVPCAAANLVANDTSYVHTGRCMSAGVTVKISKIAELRVCALKDGKPFTCGQTKYDGRQPRVQLSFDGF